MSVSYRILQAWNIQSQGPLSAVFSRAVGSWLLLFCGVFGVAAEAYAGVSLRITLVSTGIPNSQAPFVAPKVVPSASELASARAAAQAKAVAQSQKQAELRAQVKALVRVYAAKSDVELTNLSAQLQELPRLDQRVLLREVKMRMARQRGRKGSVQIRTERRFGRLLRQADGSVVRVETRVVQVRPATKDEQTSQVRVRKSGYGTGFGRRAVQDTQAAPAKADTQPEPQTEQRPAPAPPQKNP